MENVILMVHGMWCGKWVWEDYKEFFKKKGFICIAPDLRFHGEYLKNPHLGLGTTSLLDYVDDLEEIILAIKKQYRTLPIIMGHSMGGLLAQILASRGLARALVLLASAAPRGINSVEPSVLKLFLPMMVEGRNFWKKSLKPTYKNASLTILNKLSEKEKRFIYRKMGYESGRVIFEIGLWLLEWKKMAAKVKFKKINVPMLIIVGEQDSVIPVSVVEENVKKYKKAKKELDYRKYPNCAHWILSGAHWKEIAEDVFIWLKPLTNL